MSNPFDITAGVYFYLYFLQMLTKYHFIFTQLSYQTTKYMYVIAEIDYYQIMHKHMYVYALVYLFRVYRMCDYVYVLFFPTNFSILFLAPP